VGHDQRGPVHARNYLRHAVGLARAGHAEQHLVLVAAVQALNQLGHGVDLIAAQLEVGCEVEVTDDGRHGCVCRSTPSYYEVWGVRLRASATARWPLRGWRLVRAKVTLARADAQVRSRHANLDLAPRAIL